MPACCQYLKHTSDRQPHARRGPHLRAEDDRAPVVVVYNGMLTWTPVLPRHAPTSREPRAGGEGSVKMIMIDNIELPGEQRNDDFDSHGRVNNAVTPAQYKPTVGSDHCRNELYSCGCDSSTHNTSTLASQAIPPGKFCRCKVREESTLSVVSAAGWPTPELVQRHPWFKRFAEEAGDDAHRRASEDGKHQDYRGRQRGRRGDQQRTKLSSSPLRHKCEFPRSTAVHHAAAFPLGKKGIVIQQYSLDQ